MALRSRHYQVLTAVRDSVVADAELTGASGPPFTAAQWRIQKKPWHRKLSWQPGAYVTALRRQYPDFENTKHRIVFPALVAMVWPQETQDLTLDYEVQLAAAERVENLFANKGRTRCPAPMLSLDTVFSDGYEFKFEMTSVEPGEVYMDSAFQSGYDAAAVVINVDCLANKWDSSTVGA
jgi:hypothetical protein